MEGALKRVLLVDRGALARRGVAVWSALGAETVVAFGTQDAEADFLDAADFAVWYGSDVGRMDPARLISAAMDAGCEALDAGPLSNDLDLLDLALKSNLAVIGCDPHLSSKYRDVAWVQAQAGELGIPCALGDEPEGLRRLIDVSVFLDRRGGRIAVGPVECSVGPREGPCWILEHGQVPGPSARQTLTDFSLKLAASVGAAGLLRVRWAWLEGQSWALRGIHSDLGEGWPLVHAVHGFDPVDARIQGWLGGGGLLDTLVDDRHGLLLQIQAAGTGILEAMTLPEDAMRDAEVGDEVFDGQLLARIPVTAPTRQAALVRAAAALESVGVIGVASTLEALGRVASEQSFWEGHLGVAGARLLVDGGVQG